MKSTGVAWPTAGFAIACCTGLIAQESSFSGCVVDVEGRPVEGAAICTIRQSDFFDATALPTPIHVSPSVHWLELEFAPEKAGDDIELRWLSVALPQPRRESHAFLRSVRRQSGDLERADIPFRTGAATQRWLVPEAEIAVTAIESETIEISEAVHRVRFTIPTRPPDSELGR